ncbi:L,D-transpeptidase [Saccharopolyspora sp. K220]|uniref:L,D-transpeptidase family protein n=1 Tax=Saccharopolyspora soli TaxID=2926618 RepID=UPI001F5642DC|nr:L,D-transpeptidase [Saccharopolyspora soli]MCI2423448.1 L,D-transpeptidase [Saccharopolyspora soli]
MSFSSASDRKKSESAVAARGSGFRFPQRGLHVLAAVALLASGACGAPQAHPSAPNSGVVEVAPKTVDADAFGRLPVADTFGAVPDAPLDAEVRSTNGIVLHPHRELPVFDGPGGRPVARIPVMQIGSPTWLPVVARHDKWAKVLLPARPNGAAGWVFLAPSDAAVARSAFEVHVETESFQLFVTENGKEIGRWTVGVGKPVTPTPKGRTFIMASLQDARQTFSPLILPLGAHSNTYASFGGGPGTVALHGWPDPSPFGTPSSDGCIRVPDDALSLLSTLPLGTLVLIH